VQFGWGMGEAVILFYADNFIVSIQHESDARLTIRFKGTSR
jgi:hypothetical protein